MKTLDIGDIVTINDDDYVIIASTIRDNKKYLLLKEIDKDENLLDKQIIARLVIDDNQDYAIEDIEDSYLLEVLRQEFANILKKEYS